MGLGMVESLESDTRLLRAAGNAAWPTTSLILGEP